MATNEKNKLPTVQEPAIETADTPSSGSHIGEDSGPDIMLGPNGAGFASTDLAKFAMRERQLSDEVWGIASAPGGTGYCIMKLKKMLQLTEERKRMEAEARNANRAPMKYVRVRFNTVGNPNRPDVLTETITLNGMRNVVTLGEEGIISEAELEIIEHARTKKYQALTKKRDGMPLQEVGWQDRLSISIMKRDVPVEEYLEYRRKNNALIQQFQETERAKRAETQG